MKTSNEKSTASLIHLSTLTQYFIPFGNFILPLIIWSIGKDKSEYVDKNGKEVINFQLSILLYTFILILIIVPVILFWGLNILNEIELTNNVIRLSNVISSKNINGAIVLGLTTVLILVLMKITEFFLILFGAFKAADGIKYNYPFTIKFLK